MLVHNVSCIHLTNYTKNLCRAHIHTQHKCMYIACTQHTHTHPCVYVCGSISFTFGTNGGINDIIVWDIFHTLASVFMSLYLYKIMKILIVTIHNPSYEPNIPSGWLILSHHPSMNTKLNIGLYMIQCMTFQLMHSIKPS